MDAEKKGRSNRRGSRTAFQFWWEDELREAFFSLCADYDPDMPVTAGIIKCLRDAVEKYHLPGYARKERPLKRPFANKGVPTQGESSMKS